MASSGFKIAIAVVIILIDASKPTSASQSISISPLLPPSFGDVCQNVSCGNGYCRPAKNSSVPFECVCDADWKQPDSGIGFHFLPCMLPNCTIDISCAQPTAPTTTLKNATRGSIHDTCSWNICGGGTCSKSSSNHSCSCIQGYNNLMNSTSLPCYPECALKGDCPKLGNPQSTASSPSLNNATVTSNFARSLHHERLSWIFVLLLLTPIAILA